MRSGQIQARCIRFRWGLPHDVRGLRHVRTRRVHQHYKHRLRSAPDATTSTATSTARPLTSATITIAASTNAIAATTLSVAPAPMPAVPLGQFSERLLELPFSSFRLTPQLLLMLELLPQSHHEPVCSIDVVLHGA